MSRSLIDKHPVFSPETQLEDVQGLFEDICRCDVTVVETLQSHI